MSSTGSGARLERTSRDEDGDRVLVTVAPGVRDGEEVRDAVRSGELQLAARFGAVPISPQVP